ncbi:MAG TPA: helix-turn-helix domain-containing protein [Methanosarcinaceae archaeon]|nr:helix-turn-helix domain-containing protein [Methanosarcinaceae archaeon]
MQPQKVTKEEVVMFFKKHRVVTWEQLTSQFNITKQALQKKMAGYPHLTSLNQNRQYLALEEFIGETNQYGIWRHNGIVISIHGNTPKTLTHLINTSNCGLSTKQIEQITSVMCRSILLKLLKQGVVTRIKEGFDYIYLSSEPKIRRSQLEKRGLESYEVLVEAQVSQPSVKEREITNFLELDDEDYLLKRLEMVRRVKSGKSKAQVAKELECSPNTIRNACETFEKDGAKGLIITREQPKHKMTEAVEKEILVIKAKHHEWSPEKIGTELRERNLDISDRSVRIFLDKIGLIQKKTHHKA